MKNQSLKCSQQVRNLPLERFRLPEDGRKWKQVSRSRHSLLLLLASYANEDGTFVRNGRNYSPSLETLEKHVAKKSFYRLTAALHIVGLLSWTREKHYERRIYTIHIPEQVSDSPETGVTFSQNQVSDSKITGVTFASEDQNQVSDSPEQVSHSPKTGVTMGPHPSFPSKEPSKEREPDTEKPNPHSPFLNSKSGGQDKNLRSDADVASLVRDIQMATMNATNRKARFFPADLKTLSEDLRIHPNISRDALLHGITQMNLGDMPKPQFAGREIAANLILVIESQTEARTEQAQRERKEKEIIDALVENERRKSEEEDRLLEQRESEPKLTAEQLFGTAGPAAASLE